MNEIFNLRAFRKKRTRQEKALNAALNRRKHRLTKADALYDEKEKIASKRFSQVAISKGNF